MGEAFVTVTQLSWASLENKACVALVWLARPSHLTARGAKGKGRSSGSND